MFDVIKIDTGNKTEYIPYEKTVIEKRAPTDDSIRLYGEFREKAYSSILDTLEVNNNNLSVKAIIYSDLFEDVKVLKYKVIINSVEIKGEIKLRENEYKDKYSLYNEIIKESSRFIANEIIKSTGSNIFK